MLQPLFPTYPCTHVYSQVGQLDDAAVTLQDQALGNESDEEDYLEEGFVRMYPSGQPPPTHSLRLLEYFKLRHSVFLQWLNGFITLMDLLAFIRMTKAIKHR